MHSPAIYLPSSAVRIRAVILLLELCVLILLRHNLVVSIQCEVLGLVPLTCQVFIHSVRFLALKKLLIRDFKKRQYHPLILALLNLPVNCGRLRTQTLKTSSSCVFKVKSIHPEHKICCQASRLPTT